MLSQFGVPVKSRSVLNELSYATATMFCVGLGQSGLETDPCVICGKGVPKGALALNPLGKRPAFPLSLRSASRKSLGHWNQNRP
jgi:hypothetical protein